MDGKRLYCAGGTAAARYAGEYLRNFYVDLAERPGDHQWKYWDEKIQTVLQWLPIEKK